MTQPRDPTASEAEITLEPASSPAAPETELRTFLIADIRGYTTYTRERGDEAGAALASRFAELVGEVVTARDGFLLELRGDEALVVFVSARKALRAAIDLQARFIEAELPRGVGIGLDAGEAIPVGDGYRGTALNLAARLCAQAASGETLASEAVIHLAAKMDGISYVDPRSLKLKGYEDSVRAVVVVPSDRAKGRRLASGNGSRGTDRRRYAVAGVAVVVVALLAGVLGSGLVDRGGSATPTGAATPSSAAVASPVGSPGASPDPLGGVELPVLAFFDAASGALKATTPLKAPTNVSFFSNGSFWSLGDNPRALNRIDPASHEIAQSIPIPALEARGYTLDSDSIWITDGAGPHVIRIDQRTGVVQTFPIGKDPKDLEPGSDVVVGGGSVWISRLGDNPEIVRLDPETGKVQARIPDIEAFTLNFGGDALWYATGERIGRIDSATNTVSFDPVLLVPNGNLGNIAFGDDDAWVAESSTGHVWRIDRSGRQSSVTLPAGVGELSSTSDTMWASNANNGNVVGIDLVTGEQDREIDTGHATISVVAGGDQIMMAVGPTADETIAGLDGMVLTVATSGAPWSDPSPDPAMNWDDQVRQVLYITCVGLVNYPDKPAPDGWNLEPEVAAAMPTISPDGRTYTFTIKPGFMFSPPSNEPVTAETFRATIERALSPILDDGSPGPRYFSDIVGVTEYRAGKADHVSGLAASGDQLTITLKATAPDLLDRLAMPFTCPVPARTPVLLSGLDPDPPISGAGPYYLAAAGRHSHLTSRLIVLKKNPNYHGPRPQPFDNIVIKTKSSTSSSISQVRSGTIDAAMLDRSQAVSNPSSTIAAEWGPGSPSAAAGDQRWFGASRFDVSFVALNPTGPAFRDPDIRRAVSLALDRVALIKAWNDAPGAELLAPSVRGTAGGDAAVPPPDLDAARALLKGRTPTVTLRGVPADWQCAGCTDVETAIVGQLQAIGVKVKVRRADDPIGSAVKPDSGIDMLYWGIGTDYPDPVAQIGGLADNAWLGKANLHELDRLGSLSGQARVDGAAALAKSLVNEQAIVLPYGHSVYPFIVAEQISCGFVQPAIGAVDLLSLCVKDGSTPAPAPSPSP